MNKKDISEIKSLFKKDGAAIDRICGCCIGGDKKVRMTFNEAFLSLTPEESDRYFEIFRKALSGSLGKTLHSLDYTLDQELTGDLYKMLLQVKSSGLKDEELLERFYETVSGNYEYGEDYFVVMMHCNYDVPGRTSDNIEMEDASEEVYEFILCCICPVQLSEAGLCYNALDNRIQERSRDQWIKLPMNAFLFPAFNERSTDVHSVLYYTQKSEVLHPEFIDGCIGGPTPMTYKTQKSAFMEIVEETAGDTCNYDTVCQIQDNLAEMMQEHKEEPDVLKLDKGDVRRLLERSGMEEEKLEDFDRIYEEAAGEKGVFLAPNIVDTKNFSIKTPDISIKINPECRELIQVQMLDGRKCLVIPVEDNVEVNGMNVSMEGSFDEH